MCDYEGCNSEPIYLIEWYGLNQFGKNPDIFYERNSCANMEHLLFLSKRLEREGAFPDMITLYSAYKISKEKPELLSLVKRLLNGKTSLENGQNLLRMIDRDVNKLFSAKLKTTNL